VFRYAKGDNFKQYRVWPLWDYSERTTPGGKSTAINVLWPLFWYYEDQFPEYTETRYQVFPIFFANFRRYLPELWPLLEEGRIDPGPVITHDLPLPAAADGYDIMNDRQEGSVKVAVSP